MKYLWKTATASLAMTVAGTAMGQWTTSGTDIYNSNAGEVGIGITTPSIAKLQVQTTGTYTYSVYVKDTSTTGAIRPIWGETASSGGIAVTGNNTSTTGNTCGVFGQISSNTGIGVLGYAPSATGDSVGVYGWVISADAKAFYADAANGYGVYAVAPDNYFSGNVGVGTNAPAAQLHTTGTVRHANLATANTNTTLLTVNGSGDVGTRVLPFSSNVLLYENWLSTESFVVPAGITRIRAKLWGGGGASATGSSEPVGAGGYADVYIDVTPSETLTITVGAPGTNGGNGTDTAIQRSSTYLVVAYGGKGSATFPCCSGGSYYIGSLNGIGRTGFGGSSSAPNEWTEPPFPGPSYRPLPTSPSKSVGTGAKAGATAGYQGTVIIEY